MPWCSLRPLHLQRATRSQARKTTASGKPSLLAEVPARIETGLRLGAGDEGSALAPPDAQARLGVLLCRPTTPMPAHGGVLAGRRCRTMSMADRVIRWSTALAVLGVAAVGRSPYPCKAPVPGLKSLCLVVT
jgi:hypothetical protein